MSDIKSVGRVGVAHVQLVGGPLDGELHYAVIGSALVVMVPRVEKSSKSALGYSSMFFFGGSGSIEGDEWKARGKKGKVPQDVYAVYAPVVRNGKSSLYAQFEGLFSVPRPAAPAPKVDDDDEEESDA